MGARYVLMKIIFGIASGLYLIDVFNFWGLMDLDND